MQTLFRRRFILLFLVTTLVGWVGPLGITAWKTHGIPLTSWGPTLPISAPISAPMAALPPPATDTAIAGPIPQAIAPPVQTQYNYYPIVGSTATELRSQLNQQGPLSSVEGRHYDAQTDWAVHWFYQVAPSAAGCAIATAEHSVEVVFTLPRWDETTPAAPGLVAEWQRYMAALQVHENGHRDNGIAAGQAVWQVLNQFPTHPSCSQLQAAVNRALQQIIAHHNQRDIEYDRITQHGRSQGAVFPSQALSLH